MTISLELIVTIIIIMSLVIIETIMERDYSHVKIEHFAIALLEFHDFRMCDGYLFRDRSIHHFSKGDVVIFIETNENHAVYIIHSMELVKTTTLNDLAKNFNKLTETTL